MDTRPHNTHAWHTGDFRFERDEHGEGTAATMDFLKSRAIDNIYLDTTFADPRHTHFPPRVCAGIFLDEEPGI